MKDVSDQIHISLETVLAWHRLAKEAVESGMVADAGEERIVLLDDGTAEVQCDLGNGAILTMPVPSGEWSWTQ